MVLILVVLNKFCLEKIYIEFVKLILTWNFIFQKISHHVTNCGILDYRLQLRFEDGVEGIIDLAEIIQFTGVFAPLKDRDYFVQVRVNPDAGTICWPDEADLDPDVLYALVTGEPIPSFDQTTVSVAG